MNKKMLMVDSSSRGCLAFVCIFAVICWRSENARISKWRLTNTPHNAIIVVQRDYSNNLQNECGTHVMNKDKRRDNNISYMHKEIANEWHYDKNGTLTPEMVTCQSHKKVWWRCSNNHEWQATVESRTRGDGCPYCSGRRVVKGKTDLETVFPDLARQWNPQKNGELKPDMFTTKSNKKVWWICRRGHEWYAAISNRSLGNNCPYCSRRMAIKGETDLATLLPNIAKEWHHRNNGELKPHMVSTKSHKKVWWRCKKGHEWEAVIASRTAGNDCPYCSGHKVIQGETDLATNHPKLAKEWHPNNNQEVTPNMVSSGSNRKVWWKCKKGHEWQAIIASRTKGNGCPYCSGRKAIKGETDLATIYPEIAQEWDFAKNGEALPDSVTSKSGRKVWWRCSNGHEWETSIANRARGANCPFCSDIDDGG